MSASKSKYRAGYFRQLHHHKAQYIVLNFILPNVDRNTDLLCQTAVGERSICAASVILNEISYSRLGDIKRSYITLIEEMAHSKGPCS